MISDEGVFVSISGIRSHLYTTGRGEHTHMYAINTSMHSLSLTHTHTHTHTDADKDNQPPLWNSCREGRSEIQHISPWHMSSALWSLVDSRKRHTHRHTHTHTHRQIWNQCTNTSQRALLSLMISKREQVTCGSEHERWYRHPYQSHGSIMELICYEALTPASIHANTLSLTHTHTHTYTTTHTSTRTHTPEGRIFTDTQEVISRRRIHFCSGRKDMTVKRKVLYCQIIKAVLTWLVATCKAFWKEQFSSPVAQFVTGNVLLDDVSCRVSLLVSLETNRVLQFWGL